MSVKRISCVQDFERFLAESASRAVFLLKHSTS